MKRTAQTASDRLGAPVFPIRIEHEDGRFTKRPLTKRGHLDATRDADDHDWSRANGFGIATGNGLYVLDIDSYREGADRVAIENWLDRHRLDWRLTRRHRTPSGGYHLLFRTAPEHADLPSRANIVRGLDSRGAGGWIAYGQGYSVEMANDPYPLTYAAAKTILAGYSGGATAPGPGGSVPLEPYEPLDATGTRRLLARMFRARKSCRALDRRLHGQRGRFLDRSVDESRSGLDHSVAFLMALSGFTADEIVEFLLHHFEHGACRDPSRTWPERVRAARRSASKAVRYRADLEESLSIDLTPDPDAVDAYLAQIVTLNRSRQSGGAP